MCPRPGQVSCLLAFRWRGVPCHGTCSWLLLRAGSRSWEMPLPLRFLSSGFYVPSPRAVQPPPFSADFSQGRKPWSWGARRGLCCCCSLAQVAQSGFGGRGVLAYGSMWKISPALRTSQPASEPAVPLTGSGRICGLARDALDVKDV